LSRESLMSFGWESRLFVRDVEIAALLPVLEKCFSESAPSDAKKKQKKSSSKPKESHARSQQE
jgi:hypothetical protein